MYTTNLPDYSKQHMLICGLFLSKTREQKLIFQIGTLNPHGIDQPDPTLIILSSICLFAAFSFPKLENKNLSFKLALLIPMVSINERFSFHLFILVFPSPYSNQ